MREVLGEEKEGEDWLRRLEEFKGVTDVEISRGKGGEIDGGRDCVGV